MHDGSAVTRSAREHRFLFHARDTALFYKPARDFFLPSFQELWDNTIQAQAYHEDNGKPLWDNAIRYGLALTMGSHGLKNDTAREISSLVRDAVTALFQTTSLNGFFPGQLDESADGRPMPVLFDNEEFRDFYFHAHFEICHILLVNFDRVCTAWFDQTGESGNPGIRVDSVEQLGQNVENRSPKTPKSPMNPTPKNLERHEHSASRPTTASMKRTFQYGSPLDSSKIVDFDEEWLYNYPAFLGEPRIKLPDFSDISILIGQTRGATGGDWISQQMEIYKNRNQPFKDSVLSSRQTVSVIDIPKLKHVGKRNRDRSDLEVHTSGSRKEMWDKLAMQRTAEHAKKRSIVLVDPDAEITMIFYLTSPRAFQSSLATFIDQYFRKVIVYRDQTSMVYNTWITELLFSFYVISSEESESQLSNNLGHTGRRFNLGQRNIAVPKSLGFRFDGDMFDRHWTCLVVNSVANVPAIRRFTDARLDKRAKCKRKIQELILAWDNLDQAVRETRRLTQELEVKLDEGIKSFADLSSEQYLATTQVHLQEMRKLLESMNANLSMTFNVISRWDAREGERAQQPRWTRNDERKYREHISFLRSANENKTLELKDIHSDVKALEERFATTLSTNVVRIAEGRSLREAENMRLFTYVTVVFLPLGFASSVFSMSGVPDRPLLVNMITCAIVALVLTVFMLINAKELARMVQRASRAMHEYSRNKMESSAMARHHDDYSDGEGDGQKRKSRTRDDEKSWFLWFWVKYLLVEMPARRVVVAGRLLNVGERISRSADYFRTQHAPEDTETQTSISGDSIETALPFTGWSPLQVFGGLVFSPLFVASWAIQLLIYNTLDILRLVGSEYSQSTFCRITLANQRRIGMYSILISSLPTTPEYALPRAWFAPREWWRPIRRLDEHIRLSQERAQTQAEDEDAENEDDTRIDTRQDVKRKIKA